MIDGSQVFGGYTQLDHLRPIRGLQHPMADPRGLDHAVSRFQAKRGSLILVDQVEPATVAVDELKGDGVVVHHVRHRPAVRNADVGSDHGAAQTPRDQVPVVHPGAADLPRAALVQALHHQGVPGRGPRERRAGRRADLDPGPVGSPQLGLPSGEPVRVLAPQADGARRLVRAALQPDPQAVAGHDRHRRIVGGKDRLQTEAQRIAEERQIRLQVPARQPHLGLRRAAA